MKKRLLFLMLSLSPLAIMSGVGDGSEYSREELQEVEKLSTQKALQYARKESAKRDNAEQKERDSQDRDLEHRNKKPRI